MLDERKDTLSRLSRMPFAQYSEVMPIGRTLLQHLVRNRFEVARRCSFETTRSVLAMVVQSRGWTITTPLNLLDAEQFVPELDLMRLPLPAISRQVWLIARPDELGRLPERLTNDRRRLVRAHVVPRFSEIAQNLSDAIRTVSE